MCSNPNPNSVSNQQTVEWLNIRTYIIENWNLFSEKKVWSGSTTAAYLLENLSPSIAATALLLVPKPIPTTSLHSLSYYYYYYWPKKEHVSGAGYGTQLSVLVSFVGTLRIEVDMGWQLGTKVAYFFCTERERERERERLQRLSEKRGLKGCFLFLQGTQL